VFLLLVALCVEERERERGIAEAARPARRPPLFPVRPSLAPHPLTTQTNNTHNKRPTKKQQKNPTTTQQQHSTKNKKRDRAYVYWRLLSTDPEAAKRVALASKPAIADDAGTLDPPLLDALVRELGCLSSVYHRPADAFVSKARLAVQRAADLQERGGQREFVSLEGAGGGAGTPRAGIGASGGGAGSAAPSGGGGGPPVADLLGGDDDDGMAAGAGAGAAAGGAPAPSAAAAASARDDLFGGGGGGGGGGARASPAAAMAPVSSPLAAAQAGGFDDLLGGGFSPLAAAAAAPAPAPAPAPAAAAPAATFGDFGLPVATAAAAGAASAALAAAAAAAPPAPPKPGVPPPLDEDAFADLSGGGGRGGGGGGGAAAAATAAPAAVTASPPPLSSLLSDDGGSVPGAEYLSSWRALPTEVTRRLPSAAVRDADAAKSALATRRLFVLACRPVPATGQEALYVAGKLAAGGALLLLELRYTPGQGGVDAAFKSSRGDLADAAFESVAEALLTI
jgi:hypothetical protein